ncbi:MAG: PEPxxWA-CTERM sorting domain-containing protein [Sandarakinorhabdus sp.]|nr:PEPxxWA-CTERM sorting domain-containing protein [Sandarakinorhabdus sp.]
MNCSRAGVLGTSILHLGTAAGPGAASITLSTGCDGSGLQLVPGGEYVLISSFQTVANRNGFMDATNTITVQLSETLPEAARQQIRENVVTARSLVPEPATWTMMIVGFGLAGAAARRKRRTGLLTA